MRIQLNLNMQLARRELEWHCPPPEALLFCSIALPEYYKMANQQGLYVVKQCESYTT